MHLLPILLENDQVQHIFDPLPLSQPIAKGGDMMYWNSLPLHILRATTDDNLRIWPILFAPAVSVNFLLYSDIRSVLVAPDMESMEVLKALGATGVMITQPPQCMMDLLINGNLGIIPLDPYTVHIVLLVSPPLFSSLEFVHQLFFPSKKSTCFTRMICNAM